MSRWVCAAGLVMLGMFAGAGSEATVTGRTAANFSVGSDGSASYSIPIKVPPGVAGMTPSLSLIYNSRNGDGLLGVGWGIGGLSAISRCNATWAQDSTASSPQLTSADRFCLDGNRLRTTNGSTYGANGATYQSEVATFSNITSNGTAGSGPASFTVQGRNGLTYQYGATTDSAVLAYGTSSVRVWALNAVLDRNGNKMTYTYTNDTTNGSYRLASVQYTYTGSSSSNSAYSVAFTYQSRASTDQLWKYTIGGVNNQLNYLSSVSVSYGKTMVHGYTLAYTSAPVTNRMRLASVQECATNFTTDCFNATSIGYQAGQAGWGTEIAQQGDATNLAFALPIDLNGDGIDDLVYPDSASGDWYYVLGSVSGTYSTPQDTGVASTNYQSALAVDFYSNGQHELLVPYGSDNAWYVMQYVPTQVPFTKLDTHISAAGVVPGSAMVGDVDGDGRPDLIYAVSGGAGYASADYIYYRLNIGGTFSQTQSTLASLPNGTACQPCVKLGNSEPFGNPGYRYSSQTRTLDFNGDGRADLLVYLGTCNPDGSPGKCGKADTIIYQWTLFLSQPNGTYIQADAVSYAIGTTPNEPPLTGDFNGDGCTDIAYTVSNVWTLRYGTCGRTGTTSVLGPAVPTNAGFTAGTALAMDWDGDGRTDIVQPGTGANPDWMVARSTGDNLNASIDTLVPAGGGTAGAQVADVNGDGQPDMIYALSSALKTKLHSGAKSLPDLAISFVDGQGNSISPSYETILQGASTWTAPTQGFPYVNYTGPVYICVNVVYSDPSSASGSTYYVHYYYAGAEANLQRYGFIGFGAVQTYDSRNGFWDTRDYSRDAFPVTGMLSAEWLAQDNLNTVLTHKLSNTLQSTTLDATANNERYFPYVSLSADSFYEVGGTKNAVEIASKTVNYGTPDAYGNFTTITTTVTDQDSSAPASPYNGNSWTSTSAT